ncbi:MAG: biotin/lipoyl-binding protein [Prevotella sp.]|nr:biotin/lipoyl-binding protein [Prevotella sp.]
MDKYQYKVNGVDYEVEIEEIEGTTAKVTVNGKAFEVELKEPVKATTSKPAKVVAPVAATAPAAAPAPASKPAAVAGEGAKVTAPLPGTITEVKVAVGQAVKAGETVIILEAMKMQNNIEAETSGTVTSVLVGQGDAVMEGATLITIG